MGHEAPNISKASGMLRLSFASSIRTNFSVMPNIASALKSEMSRVARKEVRIDTASLKNAAATYRHEISGLKKRVLELERQLKRLARVAVSRSAPPKLQTEEEGERQLRFSAARFAAQRRKLGLSAASMAKLLGVSPLSVYKWESGKTRPRRAQLQAIAALRQIGKREANARLQQLAA